MNNSKRRLEEPFVISLISSSKKKIHVKIWRTCVTPISKKQIRKEPLNYRPISVSSTVSKNFEKTFRLKKKFLEKELFSLSVSLAI